MSSPKLEIKLSHTISVLKTTLQKDSLGDLDNIAQWIRAQSFFHLQKMNYISILKIQQKETKNMKHQAHKKTKEIDKNKTKSQSLY